MDAPLSHPFVERLIGAIRRECLDRTLFWTAADLEVKLRNVPPLTLLRWSPHLNELLQLLKPVLNHHEAQRRGGRGSVRRFQHQEPSAIG